jgi:putative transposase
VLFALVYMLLRRVVQSIGCSSNEQMSTEVELLVVRHQLMILKRQAGRPRLRRRDRLFMAAISRVLPRARWSTFLVSPQTLLRWHRELVRRKWTFRRRSRGGRPPIPGEVRDLILRMGRENPRWGRVRIRGELRKLGIRVSATKIRTLLRANGLGPAPRRDGPTWNEFLRSQAQGILALDFFTVETVMLRTVYVLFAIHLRSRRVHVLGVTRNPDSAGVTQQARNLAVEERLEGIRFVVRDRDSKFSGPFDEVLRSDGVRIVQTPIRAPRANAFAERWVRTVRTECLDWMLILGRRHLERVLRVYVAHYNQARPIEASNCGRPSRAPIGAASPTRRPRVRTHRVMGASSMSTNWLLECRIEGFCAPQGTDAPVVSASSWAESFCGTRARRQAMSRVQRLDLLATCSAPPIGDRRSRDRSPHRAPRSAARSWLSRCPSRNATRTGFVPS